MTDIHIKADKVSFSYNKQQTVLSDIGFSVRKNEIAAFVGPNGGGKTTLLRLIAGLLKPESGVIELNGRCRALSESAQLISYVPQYAKFDKQFPMTVFDVVLTGLIKPFGFYSKADKDAAMQALQYVSLEALKNRSVADLSGGQMQRMLIARALVSPKEVLLLDEPTANIDQESSDQLKSLISDLSQSITVLLVTHDTGFLNNLVNRLFLVNKTLRELSISDHYCQLDSYEPLSLIQNNTPMPLVNTTKTEEHTL
ncbi:metal ABC transporter ATP-binding protein [Reinekea thalattae]|uniref:ABC transporter ATP-binding protein n=1 Tax=Reinekea thalattae TaxID=2593301 RepID=A0A5C8Z8K3_9GAMM|nr:ABC transporter ATP-binding protein [Reinekea thalattae]TXR53491.1 ABC transporter ATP-binding protein [Reinekea thalattae]